MAEISHRVAKETALVERRPLVLETLQQLAETRLHERQTRLERKGIPFLTSAEVLQKRYTGSKQARETYLANVGRLMSLVAEPDITEAQVAEAWRDIQARQTGAVLEWMGYFYLESQPFLAPNEVILSPDDARLLYRSMYPDRKLMQAGTDQESPQGISTVDFFKARKGDDGVWRITQAYECTNSTGEKHAEAKSKGIGMTHKDYPNIFEPEYILTFVVPHDSTFREQQGPQLRRHQGVLELPITHQQVQSTGRYQLYRYVPNHQRFPNDPVFTLDRIYKGVRLQLGFSPDAGPMTQPAVA